MNISKNLNQFVEKVYKLPTRKYSVEHIQLGTEEFMGPELISDKLKDRLIDTYTYYSEDHPEISSFIAYYRDIVISIGYIKNEEVYSLYINNLTGDAIHDELYLINLKEEDLLYANLDVG